jgi:hypothetical protein
MGGQVLFGEEKFAFVGAGSTAPELARDLLVLGLTTEFMLEVVECDRRPIPPSPSPVCRSIDSTATLFRR